MITQPTQNENLNEIKRQLFGNLEVEVIKNVQEPNKIIFKHKTKFEESPVFHDYDPVSNQITAYGYHNGRKKFYGSSYKLSNQKLNNPKVTR